MRSREFISEAEYDTRINKLSQAYPQYKDDIVWAKTNLVRKDRVYWYLRQIESMMKNNDSSSIKNLQYNLMHYVNQTNLQGVQNYPFNMNLSVDQLLTALETIKQSYLSKNRPTALTLPEDVDLIKYSDGSRWVKLNRAYCKQEGLSGKHCGNINGQKNKDQRILSYRDKIDKVILTFILDPDGTLGEMKGINNTKPDKKYHKQIVDLLILPMIKGINKGDVLREADFSIFDLDDAYFSYIYDKKRELINSQIDDYLKNSPYVLLSLSDKINKFPEILNKIKNKNPTVYELLVNPSEELWEKVLRKNPKVIVYAPTTINNYSKRVIDYLVSLKSDEGNGDILGGDLLEDDSYFAFFKLPENVRLNFDFLSALLQRSPDFISAIDHDAYPRYKELASISIRKNGMLLDIIPEQYRDEELSDAAVKQNPEALEYVPTTLPNYISIAQNAINKDSDMIAYVPKELRSQIELHYDKIQPHQRDRNMWFNLIYNGVEKLKDVPKQFLDNEMILAAIRQDPDVITSHIIPKDKNGKKMLTYEMYLAAVSRKGALIKEVPPEFKDEKMYIAAVKLGKASLSVVPTNLRDRNMWSYAVTNNGLIIQYAPDNIKNDVEIAKIAIKQNKDAAKFIPPSVLTNIGYNVDELKEFKNFILRVIHR